MRRFLIALVLLSSLAYAKDIDAKDYGFVGHILGTNTVATGYRNGVTYQAGYNTVTPSIRTHMHTVDIKVNTSPVRVYTVEARDFAVGAEFPVRFFKGKLEILNSRDGKLKAKRYEIIGVREGEK